MLSQYGTDLEYNSSCTHEVGRPRTTHLVHLQTPAPHIVSTRLHLGACRVIHDLVIAMHGISCQATVCEKDNRPVKRYMLQDVVMSEVLGGAQWISDEKQPLICTLGTTGGP